MTPKAQKVVNLRDNNAKIPILTSDWVAAALDKTEHEVLTAVSQLQAQDPIKAQLYQDDIIVKIHPDDATLQELWFSREAMIWLAEYLGITDENPCYATLINLAR